MKVYYYSVAGETNWTRAFKSKTKAIDSRNAEAREYKGDTRYVVHEVAEDDFPISAAGIVQAFEHGAGQAPN